MAKPTLSPVSTTSTVILTSTGNIDTTGNGAGNPTHYPFGIYIDLDSDLYDINFINGASDQVAYTYKKLGGDVLDVELTVGNVYAAYEEACLEYSYQIKRTIGRLECQREVRANLLSLYATILGLSRYLHWWLR